MADQNENPKWLPVDPNFSTKAIHSGYNPKDWNYAPVVPSISLSTTFEQDAPAKHKGFEYSRSGNPTRKILEETLAALDNGKQGMVFASGLAATTTIVAMLNTGDRILCMDDVYGGSGRLFRQMEKSSNIHTDFVDFTDKSKFISAMRPETKLVWIESPTNPMLKVVDIKTISDLAHDYSKDCIVCVDNTFLTSYYQMPLSLGADMVMYSLTKYVSGHSDVVMGAVIMNREDISTKLGFLQNALGAIPSPFDCYLVLRSLRTLHLRMPAHMKSALAVARFLQGHPKVDRVIHPGLPSHPQHEIALKQSAGHSGLFSFYLKAGLNASKFLQNLKLFSLAESLGGHESLSEIPSLMTHASVPPEHRLQLGITDELIRFSVGLESKEDLIRDINNALESI